MKSIPNSGYYFFLNLIGSLYILCSCGHSFVCLHPLDQSLCMFIFWGGCISLTPPVYVTSCVGWPLLSVCLPLFPVLPSGASTQDFFPPECPTHVGSMSVSSRPSPHHHHTLDALWLPLQRAAWRHQWVLLLWSQSLYLSPALVVCRNLWLIALQPFCCHHCL